MRLLCQNVLFSLFLYLFHFHPLFLCTYAQSATYKSSWESSMLPSTKNYTVSHSCIYGQQLFFSFSQFQFFRLSTFCITVLRFKYGNLLRPLSPLLEEIDICTFWRFCKKSNSEQLLFEAFFVIIGNFDNVWPWRPVHSSDRITEILALADWLELLVVEPLATACSDT